MFQRSKFAALRKQIDVHEEEREQIADEVIRETARPQIHGK
jgi:hypothetical protein